MLADYNILREAHYCSYDKSKTYLTYNLELALQALLVVAEDLDVVIEKTDNTAPKGGHKEQNGVDIVQAGKQQHRNNNSEQNDNTAHRRCSLLCELPLQAEVTNILANLVALQCSDNTLTAEDDDKQCGNDRCH